MKNIMVVDDSLIIRMQLKKVFAANGFNVVAEASNGQEAVEKYKEFSPDIVTMDITMPILDGIGALKEICAYDKMATVVMISALGQELKIIEAINGGAKHYILKPFNEAEVLSIVNDLSRASA